jgi:heptosyltransferase-2/heptosyltransferase-3
MTTPIPKTDPPAVRLVRRPLRLLMLRVMGMIIPTPDPSPAIKQPSQERGMSRILLIRPDHLGDLLCVTPSLKFLREQLPGAHLTALVGPWGKPVLQNNPYLDDVQTLEFPGFTRRAKSSPFAPYQLLFATAQKIRAQHFDTAIILRCDHWWGAWLAALARIPRRIGYDIAETKPFINDVVHYEKARHEVAQNMRLMTRAVGVDEPHAAPQTHPLVFSSAAHDDDAIQRMLGEQGITRDDRFAILQAGSGAAVKLWSDEGFAHIAEALHERWRMKIVMIGGADERALVARIIAQARVPMVNLVGQTTLTQLAALFARAAIAIGTDSGPMHLAVAMHTPSVHLFGPVSAQQFAPWGAPSRHIVLISNLPCIACNRLDYTDAEIPAHPCVRLITEAQVLKAVEIVIGHW